MGHGCAKLEKIKTDCIRVNLKNVDQTFVKFTMCMKWSFIMLGDHRSLLRGCGFTHTRLGNQV